jgi:hypothetical protein
MEIVLQATARAKKNCMNERNESKAACLTTLVRDVCNRSEESMNSLMKALALSFKPFETARSALISLILSK